MDAGRADRFAASGWATPSGYLGNWARRGLAELRAGYRTDMGARASFEDHLQSLSIIAGTPRQVVEKLRVILEETRTFDSQPYGAMTGGSAMKTPRPASACSARKSCRRFARLARSSTFAVLSSATRRSVWPRARRPAAPAQPRLGMVTALAATNHQSVF